MYSLSDKIHPDALYTRIEVANLLGISVSSVYRLRRKGILIPCYTQAHSRPVYKGAAIIEMFRTVPESLDQEYLRTMCKTPASTGKDAQGIGRRHYINGLRSSIPDYNLNTHSK